MLDGEDDRQAFQAVFGLEVLVVVLEPFLGTEVAVEFSSYGETESFLMRAAAGRPDVVAERVHRENAAFCRLHGAFDDDRRGALPDIDL